MDRAVTNALKRRAELRSELSEIERFLALYERYKSLDGQPMLDIAPSSPANEQREVEVGAEAEPEVALSPSEPSKSLTRAELLPHIEAVIREAGKPLTRGVLLRKLDNRGTPVGGEADRSKNMGTIMWRLKDHFVNLSGYGYWLRSEPFEPAGYDPEDLNSPIAVEHILGGPASPPSE